MSAGITIVSGPKNYSKTTGPFPDSVDGVSEAGGSLFHRRFDDEYCLVWYRAAGGPRFHGKALTVALIRAAPDGTFSAVDWQQIDPGDVPGSGISVYGIYWGAPANLGDGRFIYTRHPFASAGPGSTYNVVIGAMKVDPSQPAGSKVVVEHEISPGLKGVYRQRLVRLTSASAAYFPGARVSAGGSNFPGVRYGSDKINVILATPGAVAVAPAVRTLDDEFVVVAASCSAGQPGRTDNGNDSEGRFRLADRYAVVAIETYGSDGSFLGRDVRLLHPFPPVDELGTGPYFGDPIEVDNHGRITQLSDGRFLMVYPDSGGPVLQYFKITNEAFVQNKTFHGGDGQQEWIVPPNVYEITIQATGAGGYNTIDQSSFPGETNAGRGASCVAKMLVAPGESVFFWPGTSPSDPGEGGEGFAPGGKSGKDKDPEDRRRGGGGAGTAIFRDDVILDNIVMLVGGGGGGTSKDNFDLGTGGNGGQVGEAGTDGTGPTDDPYGRGGSGGVPGTGGAGGTGHGANGAAGVFGTGGDGGVTPNPSDSDLIVAAAGGGGGGYFGGGGGGSSDTGPPNFGGGGGGGGSWADGSLQEVSFFTGTNEDDGQIKIFYSAETGPGVRLTAPVLSLDGDPIEAQPDGPPDVPPAPTHSVPEILSGAVAYMPDELTICVPATYLAYVPVPGGWFSHREATARRILAIPEWAYAVNDTEHPDMGPAGTGYNAWDTTKPESITEQRDQYAVALLGSQVALLNVVLVADTVSGVCGEVPGIT